MSGNRPSRRNVVLAIAVLSTLPGSQSIRAATGVELLMFEEPGCPWCARWHAEVGPGYPRSPEGQVAPLRRVDLRDSPPAGVRLALPVRASPTFVLIENGHEVDRITGYPGADFFWGLLAQMIAKLDQRKSEALPAGNTI